MHNKIVCYGDKILRDIFHEVIIKMENDEDGQEF